jgi:hypothetical protein
VKKPGHLNGVHVHQRGVSKVTQAAQHTPTLHSVTLSPDLRGLTTEEAAKLLNRQPQTMRKWAAYESGPIRPRRVHGRLWWALADIERLLTGEAAQ